MRRRDLKLGVLKGRLSVVSEFLKLNCFEVFLPKFMLYVMLFFTINVYEKNDFERKFVLC